MAAQIQAMCPGSTEGQLNSAGHPQHCARAKSGCLLHSSPCLITSTLLPAPTVPPHLTPTRLCLLGLLCAIAAGAQPIGSGPPAAPDRGHQISIPGSKVPAAPAETGRGSCPRLPPLVPGPRHMDGKHGGGRRGRQRSGQRSGQRSWCRGCSQRAAGRPGSQPSRGCCGVGGAEAQRPSGRLPGGAGGLAGGPVLEHAPLAGALLQGLIPCFVHVSNSLHVPALPPACLLPADALRAVGGAV
jgi:hypothetical protein